MNDSLFKLVKDGVVTNEDRTWEQAYRNRWSYDRIVRSTHGAGPARRGQDGRAERRFSNSRAPRNAQGSAIAILAREYQSGPYSHIATAPMLAITVPSLVFKVAGLASTPPKEALIFGLAILGAAFLLSWAAEVAQMEISQALALAILALIAILPEYAVDLYFAWRAAEDPIYGHYAAANMTGANQLLIGFGWPLVILARR